MHPREHVAANRPAIVMAATGESIGYAELVRRSNAASQLFCSLGLRRGDGIAICMENHPRYFELCWAAHDSGLYYTPISSRLRPAEVEYVLADSGARVLFASAALAGVVSGLPGAFGDRVRFYAVDRAITGFGDYEAAVRAMPGGPAREATQGSAMVYSSGTTGRPKGIRPPLSDLPVDQPAALPAGLVKLYGFGTDTVYLSPAPLYHAAPLKFSLAILAAGGTTVVMERFDAEEALSLIGSHRVTHSQWVPTMFIRMLRLPEESRRRYDGRTHRVAIHAAAPCPVDVKRQMLEWWGPILHEYYSGSESIGMCAISPQEWLAHPGSVGRAVRGELHIVGEDGRELPPNRTGTIYFAGGGTLVYHNDPAKTARAHDERGWATIGDIGHIDEQGYLYLTDRRDYVINSGGVNIYPQEAENLLALHPLVQDVAVFGVPNAEFGEEVKAVVVPRAGTDPGPELESELIAHCREHLSTIKCPKTVDFAAELPREPTGKLQKKHLREKYWPSQP